MFLMDVHHWSPQVKNVQSDKILTDVMELILLDVYQTELMDKRHMCGKYLPVPVEQSVDLPTMDLASYAIFLEEDPFAQFHLLDLEYQALICHRPAFLQILVYLQFQTWKLAVKLVNIDVLTRDFTNVTTMYGSRKIVQLELIANNAIHLKLNAQLTQQCVQQQPIPCQRDH
eukprot:NODE_25_length_41203_cov_0.917113.p18 type:complete len:172 gc:universal NODE_25_length_41203_cov_0.917113:7779-7264(-)